MLTEGCEEIEQTSAASQLAMVSALKDNVHLNCGNEVAEPETEATGTGATETESAETVITGTESTGTLFQDEEIFRQEQGKKGKKEKNEKKRGKKKLSFVSKLATNVEGLFESLGSSDDDNEKE